MNLNLPAVIMLTAGVVLMYAAVTNRDPRDIVRMSLGQPAKYTPVKPVPGVTPPPGGGFIPFQPPIDPVGHGPIVTT